MQSYELSNTQWDRIEGFLPGRQGWAGVTAEDNRNFVDGVLCCAAAPSGRTCRHNSASRPPAIE